MRRKICDELKNIYYLRREICDAGDFDIYLMAACDAGLILSIYKVTFSFQFFRSHRKDKKQGSTKKNVFKEFPFENYESFFKILKKQLYTKSSSPCSIMNRRLEASVTERFFFSDLNSFQPSTYKK